MNIYLGHLTILLLIFSCYPIGRLIGISGYLPSAIAGLIIISSPIAILANFNASLSAFLVNTLPIILLLILILKVVKIFILNWEKFEVSFDKFLLFLIGIVNCALIIFWTYTFDSNERYYSETHEYYFAAIPLELHIAEYSSRLRVFFAYPYEWSQFYFLQGASLALVTSLVTEPNFFTIRLAKFVMAIFTIAALAEILWNYTGVFYKKLNGENHILTKRLFAMSTALLFLFIMLSSTYFFAFTSGFQGNNFLAFGCVMCFAMARIKGQRAESYIWILLLIMGQLKTLPSCTFGLIIMMYYDGPFGTELSWKSPQKLIRKTFEFFSANKDTGRVILGLSAICSIYFVATMMTPGTNHSGRPFGLTSSFPYGWWIAVPEVNLMRNLWDFIITPFTESGTPLLVNINDKSQLNFIEFFDKDNNIFFPLAILGSSWLMIRYTANVNFKVGVYSIVIPAALLSFFIKPFVHTQVVGTFSFMLLVAFTVIILRLKSIKAVAVCSSFIILSLYINPVSFFTSEIVRIALPDNEQAKIIDKNDIRIKSSSDKPRNFVYCSNDDPFFNEAIGGHLGRRVALTDQNISQRKYMTIIHRHISLLNEEKLPILSSCLVPRL
ncbi:hypothetical protein N9I90_06180 [Alphaproteobacteria bacterium]|nr:hypothetical protein [Alphaproteobacteria bacterium]